MLTYTKNRGFSVVELLIISCVIFIIVGTFGVYANKLLVEAREVALRHELAALRMWLKLYQILHEKNPETIPEFFELKEGRVDTQGNLLDPFGNRYIYYPDENKVKTTTIGYTEW